MLKYARKLVVDIFYFGYHFASMSFFIVSRNLITINRGFLEVSDLDFTWEINIPSVINKISVAIDINVIFLSHNSQLHMPQLICRCGTLETGVRRNVLTDISIVRTIVARIFHEIKSKGLNAKLSK